MNPNTQQYTHQDTVRSDATRTERAAVVYGIVAGAFAATFADTLMRGYGVDPDLVQQGTYWLSTAVQGAAATGLAARSAITALAAHRLHERADSLEHRAEAAASNGDVPSGNL